MSYLVRRVPFMGKESRHPDGTRGDAACGRRLDVGRRGGAAATQAAGRWIGQQAEWKWWATLTFKEPVSDGRATKALNLWLRKLAQAEDRHFMAAWSLETQVNGRPHFHVLLDHPLTTLDSGGASLFNETEVQEIRPEWFSVSWLCADPAAGNARVRKYDPSGGAAFYLVKDGEWDLRVACPRPPECRRRNGCRFSRNLGLQAQA